MTIRFPTYPLHPNVHFLELLLAAITVDLWVCCFQSNTIIKLANELINQLTNQFVYRTFTHLQMLDVESTVIAGTFLASY